MWLSGRTGNQLVFKGANQLLLNSDEEAILKKVLKFVAHRKENKNLMIVPQDGIELVDLLQLYDTFVNKLQNSVYKVRLSAQGDTLQEKRDKFITLAMEEQCVVLSEILHLFQCQSGAADLKLIGGPGHAGILVLNNNITKCKQISIIHQRLPVSMSRNLTCIAIMELAHSSHLKRPSWTTSWDIWWCAARKPQRFIWVRFPPFWWNPPLFP